MSVIKTIPVPKLKGLDHYNSWAIDCSNTFRLEGIWEITSGEDPKPTAPTVLENPSSDQETLYNKRLLAHKESLKEWTKGNYRARAYLMLYTEEGPRTHIEGMENACDMWQKLKELYSESHFQVILSAIREIRKTHQSDYKTVLDYSEALKRLSRKCYNAKAPIPDWILTCVFLTGLKEDLEPYVFSLINSSFKEVPDIDFMAVALQDLSKQRQDEKKSKSLTAKFGNKSSNNQSKPQNRNISNQNRNSSKGRKDKSGKKCDHCEMNGHLKDRCFYLHSDIRPDDWQPVKGKKSWRLGITRLD